MKSAQLMCLAVAAIVIAAGSGSALENSRQVPARTLPVPDTASPAMQAVIGAPLSSFWNVHPKSAQEWKAFVQQRAEYNLKLLPALREKMGVKVEPTTIGGVKAFVVTPTEVAEANRNRVLIHVHGGGYVLSSGEAGLPEALMMAGHGRIKVISVDYRMPPDFPYPAAIDDAMAVYKEVLKTTDARKIGDLRHVDGRRDDARYGPARQGGRPAAAGRHRPRHALVRHDQDRRHLLRQRNGG